MYIYLLSTDITNNNNDEGGAGDINCIEIRIYRNIHINNNVNNKNNRNGNNVLVMNDHVACSLGRGSICIYSKQ